MEECERIFLGSSNDRCDVVCETGVYYILDKTGAPALGGGGDGEFCFHPWW